MKKHGANVLWAGQYQDVEGGSGTDEDDTTDESDADGKESIGDSYEFDD